MNLKQLALELEEGNKAAQLLFRRTTRCVSALYEHLLPRGVITGPWKILVECLKSPTNTKVLEALGVAVVQVPFRFDVYRKASPLKRKQMALEALHRGATRVAELRGWSQRPFNAARDGVLAKQFVNAWQWPRAAKLSPNKKLTAALDCSFESDAFRATLVVSDRKGVALARSRTIKDWPSEFSFAWKLGSLRWKSNRSVELLDKGRRRVRLVRLPAKAAAPRRRAR